MYLVVITLIAIYLLLLLIEITDPTRSRSKSIWKIRILTLPGITLVCAFILYNQSPTYFAELMGRKTALLPTKIEEQTLSRRDENFGARESNLFWYIHHYSRLYGIDPLLVRAIIEVESNFKPQAVSHEGAKGLMQINPITAKHLGLNDVFDIGENIEGGVRYLRYLLESYGWNLHMALASYNAGPANIRRYNGIPPFKETRRYISRVIKVYERLKRTNEVFNDTSRLSALLRPSVNTEEKTDKTIQRRITTQ